MYKTTSTSKLVTVWLGDKIYGNGIHISKQHVMHQTFYASDNKIPNSIEYVVKKLFYFCLHYAMEIFFFCAKVKSHSVVCTSVMVNTSMREEQ